MLVNDFGRANMSPMQTAAAIFMDKDDHAQSQPPRSILAVAELRPLNIWANNTTGITDAAALRTSIDDVIPFKRRSRFRYVVVIKPKLIKTPSWRDLAITCLAAVCFCGESNGIFRAKKAWAEIATDSHNCAAVNPKLNVNEYAAIGMAPSFAVADAVTV